MLINSNVATVDLTGSVETVEFSAAYAYYWLSNQSDGVMYASIGDPVPEVEGTYTINPGCDVRIPGGMSYGKINVIGTGKLMVYASNIAECPINSASSGADEGSVKKINGVEPDSSGNINITADNIIDGETYRKIEIQKGVFSTANVDAPYGSAKNVSVTFSKPFKSIPTVIVTPYFTDPNNEGNEGVVLAPDTITKNGFNFHFRYISAISWVAIGLEDDD